MGTRSNFMLAAQRAAALRIRRLTAEENGHIIPADVQDSGPVWGRFSAHYAAGKCQLSRGFFALSRSTGAQTRLSKQSVLDFVPAVGCLPDMMCVQKEGPGPFWPRSGARINYSSSKPAVK